MMDEPIGSYHFFTSLFFNLPDKAFVKNILSQDYSAEVPGMDFIKKYVKSAEGKSIDDILTEISVDRTYLLHGLTHDGPKPPYGSIYMKTDERQQLDNLRHINRMYRAAGFVVDKNAHQPPDYIGVELAFMEELCRQGVESYGVRKEFFTQHLGKWGNRFAREMIKFAKTDFYRGIGYLLDGFLTEEADIYADENPLLL